MSSSSWEGLVFTPKRDVWWFGCGVFGEYQGKDMPIAFQWYIGEEKSEEYKFSVPGAELDEQNKWTPIDIREYCSHPPIHVSEGTKITIQFKVTSNDIEYCTRYGNDGNRIYYSVKEGQEYDFDISSSRENIGSSDEIGQFPFIMYCPA